MAKTDKQLRVLQLHALSNVTKNLYTTRMLLTYGARVSMTSRRCHVASAAALMPTMLLHSELRPALVAANAVR